MQVTCKDCGWVHFAVTRKFALTQVAKFNKFYESLPPERKKHFGGPSSISDYEGCFCCGGNSFRPYKDGDCPRGCTIGPVIENEEGRP